MRRQLLWLGCLAATAVPAVLGLSGNQSFSRDIPIRVPPQAASVAVAPSTAAPPVSKPAVTQPTARTPAPSSEVGRSSEAGRSSSNQAGPTADRRGRGSGDVADVARSGVPARPADDRAGRPEPADDHGGGIAPRQPDRDPGTHAGPDTGSGFTSSSGSGSGTGSGSRHGSGRSGTDDAPDDS